MKKQGVLSTLLQGIDSVTDNSCQKCTQCILWIICDSHHTL
jgi:hypothetical protein